MSGDGIGRVFRKRKQQPELVSEFARRLARALMLRTHHERMLSLEGKRLLDHAAFSAFLDLRDLGASSSGEDTGRGPETSVQFRPANQYRREG